MKGKIVIILNLLLIFACDIFAQNSNVYVDESRRQKELQRNLDAIKDQRNTKTVRSGKITFTPEEAAQLEAIFYPKKYEPPKKSDYEIAVMNELISKTQNIVNEHKKTQFGYNYILDELPLIIGLIKKESDGTKNGFQRFKNNDVEISVNFKNGIIEGTATIVYKNDSKISSINATNINGELNGKATIIFKNGDFENLTFVNGAVFGECKLFEESGKKIKISYYRINNLVNGIVTQYYGGTSYAKFVYYNNNFVTIFSSIRNEIDYYYPHVNMWRGLAGGTSIYDGFLTKRFLDETGRCTFNIDKMMATCYIDGHLVISDFGTDRKEISVAPDGTTKIGSYISKRSVTRKGIILYNTGNIYEGEYNDFNGRHGLGKYIDAAGNVYEGEFKKNLVQGNCKITKKSGFYVTGTFEKGIYKKVKFYNNQNIEVTEDVYNGKIENGFAKVVYSEKSFYEGDMKNWQRSGKGYLRYDNGNLYEGDFLEDKLNGTGTYEYADGAIYKGSFKNDLFDGFGNLVYRNKNVYNGGFKEDKYHGKGLFTYADKSVIESNYENGNSVGEAKLIWSNGDYYIGGLKDFQMHGKGKIYLKNGTLTFDGEYKDGKRFGPATMYYPETKEVLVCFININSNYVNSVFTKPNGYKKTGYTYDGKWYDVKCFDNNGNTITESEYYKN